MNPDGTLPQSRLARRELLRLGAAAGLGSVLFSRLAWAAETPSFMPHVRAMVERWVGPGRFPGIAASLGLPGHEAEYVTRGTKSFSDPDPVTRDSLFRIYSMTKPITGMAAMMLIEDGKLALDQPVADILPAYANMQVQITPDGSLTDVRPAKTPITMRHLITHTSGLGYAIIQRGPLRQAMVERGVVSGIVSRLPTPLLERGTPAPSLEAFADRLAGLPLVYEPGTRWSYGLGLDLMGRVIEVVSGMGFDSFLKERLFDPLGMNSTFFQVPASEAWRLTTNHIALAGRLIPIDGSRDSIFLDKQPYPFGGSGLVSSPADYDRFLHMLANYGRFGGKRVMSEATVRLGTSDLLPPNVESPALTGRKTRFGAGGSVGIGADEGAFGWAGAAGTVANVDMKRGIRAQIYTQFMMPTALPVLGEYEKALRADLAALVKQAA